ncbi:MAG: biotin/lipoyl-binding protein, partial [Hyphomicrobiales bacterium]|nr:biotin/lipoyl-binding protein [Hyphomicrobiales bacterium]
MTSKGRTFAILGLAVLILGGAAAAFRFETQRKPAPPLIGVVRETEIRIAPEISARLASVPVKPLQSVRKGEVVAVLSSPEVAASLEEAKANLESARANLANVQAGVRQEERDTAAQNVAIAASNVTLAKEQFA